MGFLLVSSVNAVAVADSVVVGIPTKAEGIVTVRGYDDLHHDYLYRDNVGHVPSACEARIHDLGCLPQRTGIPAKTHKRYYLDKVRRIPETKGPTP